MIFKSIFLAIATIGLFLLGSCSQVNEEPIDQALTLESAKQRSAANPAEELFKGVPRIVDQLPFFSGCKDKKCSDQKLIEHLYKNVKYPEKARLEKIEGTVYIQFVVEIDGSISTLHVAKGIGGGCDEAALAAVESINELKERWSTPIHNNQASKVMYTLPIKFRLES